MIRTQLSTLTWRSKNSLFCNVKGIKCFLHREIMTEKCLMFQGVYAHNVTDRSGAGGLLKRIL